MVIVDEDVGRAHQIERSDEQPKSERILTVKSASIASTPVAKSP